MNKKINILKLNIILSLLIWVIAGSYSILNSFDIKGHAFLVLWPLTVCLCAVLLWKKYKPFLNSAVINENYIIFSDKYIDWSEIIEVYEVSPLEKLFFVLKSPEFDYTGTFSERGLVLKTLYDSYLIDDIKVPVVEYIKSPRKTAKEVSLILFYLFSFLPIVLAVLRRDYLENASIGALLIYLVILRLFPPFYLSKKLDHDTLPLSTLEQNEFKGITILKGFIFSDKLSTIPFKKPGYLDGLAIDIVFKKYIILNPRVFARGSKDYTRFVLFHELCHIRKHDSSSILLVLLSLTALDLIIPMLRLENLYLINEVLPYYEYILTAIAILYILIVFTKNKSREKRADVFGIQAIGEDGCARIYGETGISLKGRLQ